MMNITVKLSAKLQTKKLFIILSLDWEISDIGFLYIYLQLARPKLSISA